MTTDITELAQRMKAAAESVIKNHDCEWFETGRQICTVHKSKVNLISMANPSNIIALVEALEKAQRYIEELREWNAGLAQESFERQQRIVELQQGCENDPRIHEIIDLRERIAELEPIRAAAEKLVRCKGRYHSEQNYRALAALFGVTAPDLPPLDSESRTVKLPVGYTASSGHPFNEAERTVMIPGGGDWLNRFDVEHVLTAAGIKWEAE
ncbi:MULTISPECIES: ead/Ea22-like family protein [unclassified Raoultella]|uniref:ead/Ea22-like family protein n=1 Tax=unclassified Raoultella TaxID=2627600 RepID=UPI00190F2863